jgi:hypothetical protein
VQQRSERRFGFRDELQIALHLVIRDVGFTAFGVGPGATRFFRVLIAATLLNGETRRGRQKNGQQSPNV